jgi:hypothetical protein
MCFQLDHREESLNLAELFPESTSAFATASDHLSELPKMGLLGSFGLGYYTVWLDVLQWWGKGVENKRGGSEGSISKDEGVNPAGDTFLANLWAL